MRSRLAHFVHLLVLTLVLVLLFALQLNVQAAAPDKPTRSAAAIIPNCMAQAAATTEAGQAPESAVTAAATMQAVQTMQATEAASAGSLLLFKSFEPTDFKFNPNPDKPVALVVVFSLVFQSASDSELSVQHPRLKLSIDGVPWGELSSTDFQTGILRAHATQGIVLQSLLLVPRATDDQQAMLACIKNGIPVDLLLTGTFETYPGGTKQLVNVSFLTPQTVIRAHP